MSNTTRNYVRGSDPMYRAVVEYPTGRIGYFGPYSTLAAAKRQRSKAYPSWVEVCRPIWERLEE